MSFNRRKGSDKPERFPLDFDAIEKGDVISQEEVEEIVGMEKEKDPEKFNLLRLQLIGQIIRELRDRDRFYTICQKRGSICILEDKEASPYNEKSINRGVHRMAQAQRRNLAVDTTKLTEKEQQAHSKRLLVGGALVAACYAVRRSPKLAAAIRNTPLLKDLLKKTRKDRNKKKRLRGETD